MSDVINTDSYGFKLYANRRVRKGPYWNLNEVIPGDTEKGYLNICTFVRNVVLQACHRCMINMGKLILGLIIGMFIITPVMTFGLWLFTDNPFIFFFGKFGEIIMVIEAFCLAMFAIGCIAWAIDQSGIVDDASSMSAVKVTTEWIKAKHGKFCFNLKFDKVPEKEQEQEKQEEWERE